MNKMCKSSFCGVIEELPGVFVDNFERAAEKKARAYFLSHCHTDHTQGLYDETLIRALKESEAKIYMSEPSAAIIANEAADKRILEFIKPLKLEATTILLPSDSQRNFKEILITVTLIPAGHCFGSVMFLFQTPFKTILYTGDFRVSSNDLPKKKELHNGNEPINIDVIYLDTTFLNHRHKNFPQRSVSVEATIDEIRNWLRDENNGVALHTSAKYGYEFVFNEIFKKLRMKVYVNDNRWNLYSKLKHLVQGVTNEENTRIHICRNYSERMDHTKCMTAIKTHTNFLYIHFSAMKWDCFEIEDKAIRRVSENRLDVCFATHCSFSELQHFVRYFAPKKVFGFPNKFCKEEIPAKKIKMAAQELQEEDKRQTSPAQRGGKRKLDINVHKKMDKGILKKIFEL